MADELDQLKQKLIQRKDALNPHARLEVAKLQDYIQTVRQILDEGEIRLNRSGLLLGTYWDEDDNGEPVPVDMFR